MLASPSLVQTLVGQHNPLSDNLFPDQEAIKGAAAIQCYTFLCAVLTVSI